MYNTSLFFTISGFFHHIYKIENTVPWQLQYWHFMFFERNGCFSSASVLLVQPKPENSLTKVFCCCLGWESTHDNDHSCIDAVWDHYKLLFSVCFLLQNMVMAIPLMAKMVSWLMPLHQGQELEETPILMMMNCGLLGRDKVPDFFMFPNTRPAGCSALMPH